MLERISVNWERFVESSDLGAHTAAMVELGMLAEKHIYFRLLYTRCFGCILERVAEGIMEVAIVGIHTVEITRIELPDFLRLDDMESAAVFLIEGLHFSDEEEAVKII